jgi:hypothetical protein
LIPGFFSRWEIRHHQKLGSKPDRRDGSRPGRHAVDGPARIVAVKRFLKRRDEVFLTLALEFFLDRFETRDPRCDLFALSRQPFVFLRHASPFLIRIPHSFASEIEARIWMEGRGIVIVDKEA